MRWTLILIIAFTGGCTKKKLDEPIESPPVIDEGDQGETEPARHLYVATGTCYAGPNTTFSATTASNLVYRLNLETATRDLVIADYWAAPANAADSPVGVSVAADGTLRVLVENTTTSLRRIERVKNEGYGERSTFSANVTALNQNLRGLLTLANGDQLVTKRTGIEYLTATGVRIGAPFGNPSASPCASSNSGITRSIPMAGGKIIFLHAAASQNRIGVLGASGGTACVAVQAAPTANAYPTAGFYDEASGTLVVAYAGASAATDLNSIYAYDIDAVSGAISNPRKLYDAGGFPATYGYLLYSISEMIHDPKTGDVYVSTAVNAATPVANFKIEKLHYDPSKLATAPAEALARVETFYPHGADTKCISQMIIN